MKVFFQITESLTTLKRCYLPLVIKRNAICVYFCFTVFSLSNHLAYFSNRGKHVVPLIDTFMP
jgi:hypothetical protein